MAAPSAAQVRVGIADAVTGGVYSAPAGTALPTNATVALNVAFLNLGFISEDGVVQSIGADITTIKAWQGGTVVRKVQTSHDLTYQFTGIEMNDAMLDEYYGAHAAGTTQITATVLPHREYIISIADGTDLIRIVIPDGQIVERGDVVYKNDTAIGYQVTVTAYPDSTGVKAYIYQSGPDS